MTDRGPSPWTEELDARLAELWLQGMSTGEIGRTMGITKNSVVGRAHRLRLLARPSPIVRGGRGWRRSKVAVPTLVQLQVPVPVVPPLPPSASVGVNELIACSPAPAPAAPPVRPRRIQECCWPIGDPGAPGFRYCDAAYAGRGSYCPEHAAGAFARRPRNGHPEDRILAAHAS